MGFTADSLPDNCRVAHLPKNDAVSPVFCFYSLGKKRVNKVKSYLGKGKGLGLRVKVRS